MKKLGTGYQLGQQRRNVRVHVRGEFSNLIREITNLIADRCRKLDQWISQEDERYQKRIGGLGRKRK